MDHEGAAIGAPAAIRARTRSPTLAEDCSTQETSPSSNFLARSIAAEARLVDLPQAGTLKTWRR